MGQEETKTKEQEVIEATAETAIARADEGRPLVVKDHSATSPVLLGKVLAASGFFRDTQTAAQCAVKVMAGQELGIPPIAAMTGIHIVKSKVMLGATLLAGLVDRHRDYRYVVTKMTNECVEIEFYKDDNLVGKSSFTVDDARKMGTQNMEKMPRNMLMARAMSNGVKWYCPAVLAGMPVYVDGEIEEPILNVVGDDATEAERLDAALTEPTPTPEQSGDTEPETPGIEPGAANTGDPDVGRPEYTGPTVGDTLQGDEDE